MVINGTSNDYPIPDVPFQPNFEKSQGFMYEAKFVRECLLKGNLMPNVNVVKLLLILFQKILHHRSKRMPIDAVEFDADISKSFGRS